MSEEEAKEVRLEEEEGEQEKVLTLKISLEGPAEFVSWLKESTPARMAQRLADRLPGDFKTHVRAAQREQLLAMRSLLDAMIERVSKEEKPPKRAVKVDVE